MATVIDNPQQAGEAKPFKFKVYLSQKDEQTVLGVLEAFGIRNGTEMTWIQTPFGMGVEEAFRLTMTLADQHGIQFVHVSDPDNLFPPNKRSA